MSPCAGTAKGFVIRRLDRFDRRNCAWRESLVEDHTAGPAEIAATRLDFYGWLSTLSTRDRKLAETLAMGETTGRVARMFRISNARVSQPNFPSDVRKSRSWKIVLGVVEADFDVSH